MEMLTEKISAFDFCIFLLIIDFLVIAVHLFVRWYFWVKGKWNKKNELQRRNIKINPDYGW